MLWSIGRLAGQNRGADGVDPNECVYNVPRAALVNAALSAGSTLTSVAARRAVAE